MENQAQNKIPSWIDPNKEYSLKVLVVKRVFPNMRNYQTVLNNLIKTDIIKHRVAKYFGSKGEENLKGRRYYIYGWSLIEYLERVNSQSKESEVVEYRKEQL